MVLLRIAIGWHFLYEGVEKVYSTPEGRDGPLAYVLPRPSEPEPPFSAEGYLRNASGPLAPKFREMVPDIDGLEKLEYKNLKARWEADLERFANHYRFDDAARKAAREALDGRLAIADAWFRDLENAQKIKEYGDDLRRIDQVLANPRALKFDRERAYKDRREADATRRELVGTVDAWTQTLHDAWTPKDKELAGRVGRPVPLMTKLDWINALTKYGMVAVGVCLILGFLTTPASLGAAGFLAMFYLSMPPWPGLPSSPMQEGHYLFVNKNLIELIACLLLASTPSGRWVGLDAWFAHLWRRRRAGTIPDHVETRGTTSD